MAGGLALGAALIRYYGRVGLPLPIGEAIAYFMPFDTVVYLRFAWEKHWFAVLAVFVTCTLAALAPALRAARLRPAEALRHV
jgi:ABC-type lipoprotein release transport system permease subunit